MPGPPFVTTAVMVIREPLSRPVCVTRTSAGALRPPRRSPCSFPSRSGARRATARRRRTSSASCTSCRRRSAGAGAVIVFREPWITVRENGAVDVIEPTDRSSPVGTVANDRVTVLGSRRTEVVPVRPPLSVAVRTSSIQLGYSWSGAANEARGMPADRLDVVRVAVVRVRRAVVLHERPRQAGVGDRAVLAVVGPPENSIVSPTAQVRVDERGRDRRDGRRVVHADRDGPAVRQAAVVGHPQAREERARATCT